MGSQILGYIARSRYTEACYNWTIQIIRGYYRIVETYIRMNMAISQYGYGRGGKCVHMFRHTYTEIREMKMKMEKESRHVSRVMRTSIGTVTKVFIIFAEKEERKQKGS